MLIMLAASDGVVVSDVALPLWYGILLLVAARLIGGRLRHLRSASSIVLSAPVALVAWVLLVRVSPSTYGHVAGGPFNITWLAAFADDIATGSSTAVRALGLLPLATYLWYRGVRLGTHPPLLDDVLRRFKVGMAVFVVAVADVAVTPTVARGAAIGAFTLLLPIEVFCGLAASALARLTAQPLHAGEAEGQRPWVSAALALAGGMVAAALVLGLVINGDNVSALMAHLGPLGAVLDGVMRWITDAIGQVVGFVFGVPIRALKSAVGHATAPPISVPTTCPTKPCTQPANPPPPLFLIVLAVVFYAFLLLALILLILRLYRMIRDWLRSQLRFAPANVVEERESLDGRSLLRAQLRGLFRRRRPKPARPSGEPLDPRSLRGLYREVLRAAALAGVPRHAAETPDEFAKRAASVPPLALNTTGDPADLAVLTESYDAARYGEHEGSATERATAGQRAHRLLAQLRSRRR